MFLNIILHTIDLDTFHHRFFYLIGLAIAIVINFKVPKKAVDLGRSVTYASHLHVFKFA